MEGVPFDAARGVVPSAGGRVLHGDSDAVVPRLYVSGWAKRGASGIIGTNIADAAETAGAIVDDQKRQGHRREQTLPRASLWRSVTEAGTQIVSFEQWRQIDAEEQARGRALGKPREKFLTRDQLLHAANAIVQ